MTAFIGKDAMRMVSHAAMVSAGSKKYAPGGPKQPKVVALRAPEIEQALSLSHLLKRSMLGYSSLSRLSNVPANGFIHGDPGSM